MTDGTTATERLVPLENPGCIVQPVGSFEPGSTPLFVMKKAFMGATRHAAQNPELFSSGWFLGGLHAWEGIEYVMIEGFLPARCGLATATTFQFTDACRRAFDEDRKAATGPGGVPAGWMLAMPGIRPSMGGANIRVQRAWFGEPWQVHLAVDPVSGEAAWFRWSGDSLTDTGFLMVSHRT